MKSKTLPLFVAALFVVQSAHAAQFTWDITPGTVGAGDSSITGGAGTWNTTNGNWTTNSGANNVVWSNTSADEAIFGDTAGTVTINTGTGVTANKLTINSTGYTISGNVATDVITLAGTTPTITVTSSGHTAAISAGIAGSSGLTKSGAGALALSGALAYSGSTTVADGALSVSASLPSSNLVLNGGVFSPGTSFSRSLGTGGSNVRFTGSGGFWAYGANKTARLGSASSVMTWGSTTHFLGTGHSLLLNHETSGHKITFENIIDFNGAARTVEVRNGSAAIDGELSGVLQGTGSSGLVKTGTGTLSLTNANTYAGATTISDGSLHIGNGGATGRLTATSAIINDANLTITRNNAFTQATDLGAGVAITGSGSFTQAGSGTTTLTANNSYSGATTVNAGTLLVNGTHSGTGAVTVASGAKLGGGGVLAASTTISGILAPGNSIGTFTVGNDVTWQGTATVGSNTDWQYELGLSNSSDLLNLTGSSSEFLKNTSLGSFFRFDFLGSTATGTFTLVDWESTANLAGGALGTDFQISDFSYTNLGGGNSGSFGFSGTSLQFTVVPEPDAALIGGIGALFLLRRRRSNPK